MVEIPFPALDRLIGLYMVDNVADFVRHSRIRCRRDEQAGIIVYELRDTKARWLAHFVDVFSDKEFLRLMKREKYHSFRDDMLAYGFYGRRRAWRREAVEKLVLTGAFPVKFRGWVGLDLLPAPEAKRAYRGGPGFGGGAG